MEILPPEMLVSIFKNLSQQDLISSTRVCNRFNSAINKSGFIRKLLIRAGKQNLPAINDASWIPKRKYSEAKVTNFKPQAHLNVIEDRGRHLTTLELDRSILKLIHVVKILRLTPNVKFLTFSHVKVTNALLSGELPRLQCTSLKFSDSDPNIFRALQNVSTMKAELSSDRFAFNFHEDYADFERFLQHQTRLTSLSFTGMFVWNLFRNQLPEPTYQLKEFAMCCYVIAPLPDELENFLMGHVRTIEKFVVKDIHWDPSPVLNQCGSLKSLECNGVTMFSLNILPTVEVLSEVSTEDSCRTWMNRCPNVKKLTVFNPQPGLLQSISRSFMRLQDITIKSSYRVYDSVAGLVAPTLKKVRFDGRGFINTSFFAPHNQIEELVFANDYDMNDLNDSVNDALLESITSNLVNLRVLEFGPANCLTSRAFTIIRNNCRNLKVFKMETCNPAITEDGWKCLNDINGLQAYIKPLFPRL